jgi:PBSX family phage terminase large subunit
VADLTVRYQLRGAAAALFASRDDEVCICGPAGTGKSLAALYRMHLTCLGNDGVKALIVRQTSVSLTGTTLTTFEEFVVGDAIRAGDVRWYGGSARKPPAYLYEKTGSRIIVGGLDQPTKFMSAELDLIFVDEATETTERAVELLLTRLRGTALTNKQIILACNPDRPQHWIKQRCDRGATKMLTSRHQDNPALYAGGGTWTSRGVEYRRRLDQLTGVRKLRLRDGMWAAAEGVIYEEWNDAVHLVDQFPIPDDWPRIWSVDFGFVHPFVCQSWVLDPDRRMILEWEVYHTHRTNDQHAVTILDQVSRPDSGYRHPPGEDRYAHHGRVWFGPKPRVIVCDHDAEGRAVLERELGMRTRAAKKSVRVGIEAVQRRMRVAEHDGKPRLVLMRDAVVKRDPDLDAAARPACTAEEVGGYVWAVASGETRDQPKKIDDDGCDAMRYAVMQADAGTTVGSAAPSGGMPSSGGGFSSFG